LHDFTPRRILLLLLSTQQLQNDMSGRAMNQTRANPGGFASPQTEMAPPVRREKWPKRRWQTEGNGNERQRNWLTVGSGT
jgi:hypothetical protein